MAKVKSKKIPTSGKKKLKKINMKQKSKESSSSLKLKHKRKQKEIIQEESFENDSSCSNEDIEELGEYNEENMIDDSMNSEDLNDNSDNESVINEDEASKHKKDLEKLKQNDPEFYKFLQENDKKLLQFNLSDDEDDNEQDVEDIHKPSGALDVASDESDFEVVLLFNKLFIFIIITY